MLGQKYFKQQGKGAVINNDYFSERAKIRLVTMVSFTLLLLMCIYPETSFAALNSLEAQLDKVGTLTNSKVKTIGFSVATILGGIGAAIKGNLKLAALIVSVGVGISLYLEWIAGGMALTIGQA